MQPTRLDPAWPGTRLEDVPRLLGSHEVHLWWMDLAAPAWPLEALPKWLDAEETARAARFHFEVHRQRFVAAHGQMRALLGAYTGQAPETLRFTREALGMPRLETPGRAEPLGFNLSHSDDQGLLAIARTATIGADIEVQRHLTDLDSLALRNFAAAELRALRALPAARRHDAFFAAWTRKEAYVKALGAGLSVPLDGFEVALHPDEPAALRSIRGSQAAAKAWTLWAARPLPSSWAAIAVRIPGANVRTFSLPPHTTP